MAGHQILGFDIRLFSRSEESSTLQTPAMSTIWRSDTAVHQLALDTVCLKSLAARIVSHIATHTIDGHLFTYQSHS
jgi:hypothetical protein